VTAEDKQQMLQERKGVIEDRKDLILENISLLLEDKENEGTPLRNDEIQTSYTRESLLKNAPKTENGYFMVPNIMI